MSGGSGIITGVSGQRELHGFSGGGFQMDSRQGCDVASFNSSPGSSAECSRFLLNDKVIKYLFSMKDSIRDDGHCLVNEEENTERCIYCGEMF